MLFATQPDKYDKHSHLAEVDDQGDGISDEAGNPPHVHEISMGAVVPYQDKKYASEHPGDLILVDDGSQQMPQQGNQQPTVKESIDAVFEGHDPYEVASFLLFGEIAESSDGSLTDKLKNRLSNMPAGKSKKISKALDKVTYGLSVYNNRNYSDDKIHKIKKHVRAVQGAISKKVS